MAYFDKEEIDYLISIRDDSPVFYELNYQFIPRYIKDYSKDLPFINDDNYLRYEKNHIIDIINRHIESRLSKDISNVVFYKLISYILKREMNFDIEVLIKGEHFINIIKRASCNNSELFIKHYKNDLDRVLEHKVSAGEKILSCFVDLLYSTDKSKEEKEQFKKERKLTFRLLAKDLIPRYENGNFNIIQNPLSDEYLDNKKEDLLLSYNYDNRTDPNSGLYGMPDTRGIIEGIENIIEVKLITRLKVTKDVKQEVTESTEPKSTNETVVGTIQVATDKQKEIKKHYKSIAKSLEQYITNGKPEKYKCIFEDKTLKDNMRVIAFNNLNKKK